MNVTDYSVVLICGNWLVSLWNRQHHPENEATEEVKKKVKLFKITYNFVPPIFPNVTMCSYLLIYQYCPRPNKALILRYQFNEQ